jgi:hypothetical protein
VTAERLAELDRLARVAFSGGVDAVVIPAVRDGRPVPLPRFRVVRHPRRVSRGVRAVRRARRIRLRSHGPPGRSTSDDPSEPEPPLGPLAEPLTRILADLLLRSSSALPSLPSHEEGARAKEAT